MKLLVGLCFLLVLALPAVLLLKRKMNVTLVIFYIGLALFTLGELAGSGGFKGLTLPTLALGISGFAVASGIEFAIRRELTLAVLTTLLLLCFAYSWHYLSTQGAFA